MASLVSSSLQDSVEIYFDKTLGMGTYGQVCKAKYGQLMCAAKVLHHTLFQFSSETGTHDYTTKFEQECEFLSAIKHPNIVQHLGTFNEPKSGRPVLLMEMLDESLTDHLKRHTGPLPYHRQVNTSHDVALALSYLHSNGIMHRDLSSNNVLLVRGGSRCKMTDFSLYKLVDANPCVSPLTNCQGTLAYMAPEVLLIPPNHSSAMDCFSLGVLMVQIITRNFPNPGDAHKCVEDATHPTGRVVVQFPELERRKKDIDLVEPGHPLLLTALHCLQDRATERPSSDKLCETLSSLKTEDAYSKSMESSGGLSQSSKLEEELEAKENIIQELQLKLDESEREIEQVKEKVETAQQLVQENIARHEKEEAVQKEKFQAELDAINEEHAAKVKAMKEEIAALQSQVEDQKRTMEKLDQTKTEDTVSVHIQVPAESEIEEVKSATEISNEIEEKLDEDQEGNPDTDVQVESACDSQQDENADIETDVQQVDPELARDSPQEAKQEDTGADDQQVEESLQEPSHDDLSNVNTTVNSQLNETTKREEDEESIQQKQEAPVISDDNVEETESKTSQSELSIRSEEVTTEEEATDEAKNEESSANDTTVQYQVAPLLPLTTSPSPSESLLIWREGTLAPDYMTALHGTVVVHGNTAYFSHYFKIYSYQLPEDKWEKLKPSQYQSFSMVVIDNMLTTIGGISRDKKRTKCLYSLTSTRKGKKWAEHYPPMSTQRVCAAALTTPTHLVVAGGRDRFELRSVELMNRESFQWSAAVDLPEPMGHLQMALCNGGIYICNQHSFYSCSLEKFLHSSHGTTPSNGSASMWIKLPKMPAEHGYSFCSYAGQGLAIGGENSCEQATSTIHVYSNASGSWVVVGQVPTVRVDTMVAVLAGGEVLVVGGWCGSETFNVTEIATRSVESAD